MTREEAKKLKEGQEIWYIGLKNIPEMVTVSKVEDNNGKLEIYLTDNSYIPERSFNDAFVDMGACVDECEKRMQESLNMLREMLEKSKHK